MTRKKVKLAFITNDSARKATYKKRKKGLLKKVHELSTLCDILACAIIYSQYDSQPEVWPSPFGVQRVLSKFKMMPEMEQNKKMVNQASFLKERIMKATEQLKKLRKDNREKELTRVMFQCVTGKPLYGLNMFDLNNLRWEIDQNMKDLESTIQNQKEKAKKNQALREPTLMPAKEEPGMERQTFKLNNMKSMQRQPLIMDMMNPHDQHIGFGAAADEMILPFEEQNQINAIWYNNPLFP